MIRSSISVTQRSIANRSLARTLLFGLGGSLLCHTVAIAGINYFAQNAQEPIEIISIDRVEVDPEPVTKPAVTSPVRAIAPIAKPPLLAAAPKVVKSISATVPIPKPVVNPTPRPISTPPPVVKITKNLAPIQRNVPLNNFVSPQPKPVAKPLLPNQDFRPKIDRSQLPPFTANLFKETNNQPAFGNTPLPSTQATPKINQKIENNDNHDRSTPKQPDRQSRLVRSSPRLPIDNHQTSPANTNNNSQNKSPQDLGKLPENPTGDNFPIGGSGGGGSGDSSQITPNNTVSAGIDNQPVAGAGNRRSGLGEDVGGKENRQNGSPGGNKGTGNGGLSNSSGNDPLGTEKPGNIATGGNKQLSIQCLSNCDIKYPDNLEDADTGKNKILVRVTIDAAGKATNVEIARSSGNPKLDSFTITGVQQMQFTGMGKSFTFKIKVSTLVGN
jgi:TonB family protein